MLLRAIGLGALLLSAAGEPGAATTGAQSAREVRRLGAPTLSAAQVVERNAAARGGREAWRKIETMAWSGRVEGGSPAPLSFLLELRRPNKTRFRVTAGDRQFLRIFDGSHGWRVRPGADGAPDVRAFSREEESFARDEFVVDGPLMDHVAKGVRIQVAGMDELEGRKAHLLEVTLPSGASRRIWIDAETFLELRSDRPSTSPASRGAPVSVYYRDYRSVEGLMIPLTIEIPAADGRGSERLVLEKVALNPDLPEQTFSKPASSWKHRAQVRVGGDAPPAPRPSP